MGYGNLGLYRKFISSFKRYKPDEYWIKRGSEYKKNFQHSKFFLNQEKQLINLLNQQSFESVLEFGCGFGRISKLLLENFPIKKYHGFDISPDQIENTRKLCSKFTNADFEISKINEFKSPDKFDLVIGVEVLMHIPPNEIQNTILKLVGLSNHHFINLDWFPSEIPNSNNLEPHNFIHPYHQIYESNPLVQNVKKYQISDLQAIFHAIIKS